MNTRVWIATVALSGTLACGSGDDSGLFNGSDAGDGAGGSGAGAGGAAGSGASGAAGSGTSGAAGAGGGTGGTAGSAGAAGSGVSGTGGSAGSSAGGQSGAAGNGGGAGGGTSGCGPAPGAAGLLLLHTTLDDAASVSSPLVGDGASSSVATTPSNDFHGGACDRAVLMDADQEYVRFAQRVGSTDHIDFNRGTIDFLYQPSYAPDDDKNHFLFVVTSQGGGFRLRKASASNLNHLQFIAIEPGPVFVGETQVRPTDLPFTPGTWVRITVTWDFAQSGQQVRIYFDAQEATYSNDNGPGTVVGATPSMPNPTQGEFMYIGADGPTSITTANGLIDDFKIYSDVVIP